MTDSTLAPLFSWRSAICDSDLPPTSRHVALTLALYMNDRGSSAYPGARRLASDTALHELTVRRQLKALVAAGWLVQSVRGGRKGQKRTANVYVATIPATWEPSTTPDPAFLRPPTQDQGSGPGPLTDDQANSPEEDLTRVSSSREATREQFDGEEDNPILAATWEQIARLRLNRRREAGGKITNTTAWLRKVQASARDDLRDQALGHLDRFELDPSQLVALLEDGDTSVLRHAAHRTEGSS